MKIVKFGEKMPRFHGIVHEDFPRGYSYTMLMPFNLIAMFVIFCVNAVKFRIPMAVNEQPVMVYAAGHELGFAEGFQKGLQTAPVLGNAPTAEPSGPRRIWLLEDQDGNRMYTEDEERAGKWADSVGETMTLTEFRQCKS